MKCIFTPNNLLCRYSKYKEIIALVKALKHCKSISSQNILVLSERCDIPSHLLLLLIDTYRLEGVQHRAN